MSESLINNVYITHSKGVSAFHRPVTNKELLDTARSVLDSQANKNKDFFDDTHSAKNYFRLNIGSLEREVFACAFLSNNHQLIEFEVLFMGTIDTASVYPREVVKRALQLNAAAIVLGHNHPSGNTTPGEADKHITKAIKDALVLFDIRILDHIIVGPSLSACSFADVGLL